MPATSESVHIMARACCLVAVAPKDIPLLTAALAAAVEHAATTIARFDIALLNALAPDVLILDIDDMKGDPAESLRQLRFVLPECIIVVYTCSTQSKVVRDCHNAGANCLLSKSSSEAQLVAGLRLAMWSGCYTDPRFVA
jgi:DNA-binding NarL/FixJ family response regulator